MIMSLPNRNEVPIEQTWDLSTLFPTNEAFYAQLDETIERTKQFNNQFANTLNDATIIEAALDEYAAIKKQLNHLGNYASLLFSVDQTDETSGKLYSKYANAYGTIASLLTFVESEILSLDADKLTQIKDTSNKYKRYLEKLITQKPYQLHPEVEKTLAAFSPVFNAPYNLYDTTKMQDIDFGTFSVNGQEIPMSYVSFEGELEVDSNTELRRNAFRKFSDTLKQYENTTAKTYDLVLQQEKIESKLRGYESVIDYLLHPQEVSQDLYHRQIDLITTELAPHMRRYAKLLQKTNGLATMKFEDLKISLDESYEPEITVEESRDYIKKALSIMGEDYMQIVNDAYDKRQIDFVQNKGKSTGAFCASPYQVNPFILISWTSKMTEVFVLAHELGHAGHFQLAHQNQNIFDESCSLYFVEAPSTMNEMLMANYLLSESNDPKFKRWVIASIISRTYYHNFVTHLLEAAYQREVYRLVDLGESMTADTLNRIKRQVIEDFWGDAVEITDGAELTWMRQPHYYMGLYPYTYSAGLTISTIMSQRILKEGEPAVKAWIEVLKQGGALPPVELAKMAGIDLTTDGPLKETIAYIGALVDELEKLTEEIEQQQ
ncbi:oligoendopeptidase F [Macrococcus capreoli]|uniref:oligoendopeptidase F n=1 Tax=Macrococcus capreoli TaxID=2982690 RepID=UPI0021D56A2E|nr:oligoendopeptidase F [Macrococcus sp. TMW 2.2395]MCU7558496.1 oligoendopeptidase F [Macrococcus sp. TMW 2.2395]